MNILFVIDNLEFKYFEFNKLVTSFWLIAGFIKRGYCVDIVTKDKLYLDFNIPMGLTYKTNFVNNDLIKAENYEKTNLNNYDVIFFRPDPPVDNDFINATYVLDYLDKKTLVLNSPQSLRNANEKLFINNFPKIIPQNIVTADDKLIREFLYEKKEIIIKPLNCCFSKGVFYLNDKDKNIHTIIDMATNSGKTMVMVQEFLPDIKQGDKRLVYIDGEIFEECVGKIHGEDDFKFNTHSDEFFKKGEITPEERKIAEYIKPKMEEEGLYIAGLDVINGKVIEINVTSPCFFIKEVNQIFGINFEDKILDKLENLIKRKIN
ncbi:MAG: glutathione synthase [Candidatus Gastranaerophilales bacterium]|nr:glutathione synthase [Candidatus Gastranaerophilales bacterium]